MEMKEDSEVGGEERSERSGVATEAEAERQKRGYGVN